MKKVLFAAFAGMFLLACNNVKQYEAPIQTLSAQWDSTATVVSGFATLLNQDLQNARNMFAGMQAPEETAKKMKDDATGKLQELQTSFLSQVNVLTGVNEQLNAFVATWDEKGQALTSLKDGLAAGKLEEGVDATISELQTLVGEAGTKVGTWTEQVNAAKAAMEDLAKQSSELLQ